MIDPRNLDTLLHPTFDPTELKNSVEIGKGLAASPGAASGKVVFTANDAKKCMKVEKSSACKIRNIS